MSLETFQTNFIFGVKQLMAKKDLKNLQAVVEFLELPPVSFYKTMSMRQLPNALQGIALCEKAGYNANWVFCGLGEMEQNTNSKIDDILSEIKQLKKQIITNPS